MSVVVDKVVDKVLQGLVIALKHGGLSKIR